MRGLRRGIELTPAEADTLAKVWSREGQAVCDKEWGEDMGRPVEIPMEAREINYKERRVVYVYNVYVINRETEEVLSNEVVTGESESDAMIGFPLSKKMVALKKQDKLALIATAVGSFDKVEVQEVRIRNESTEEE